MPIREHANWTVAISDAVKAARNSAGNQKQGNYDSHAVINYLNEHHNAILNEIVDSYFYTRDGRAHDDPVREATN